MTVSESPSEAATTVDVAALSGLLLASLKALADAGEGEKACMIAGQACAVFRKTDADEWRRYNVLLHRLGPKTGPVGTVAEASDS